MNLKSFINKRNIIWGVIIVLVLAGISYKIFKPKDPAAGMLTDKVARADLRQTVLATGQVTSSTDLNLSFKGSGIVTAVNVNVGKVVKAGDTVATLDQKDQLASYTTARGSLAQAQANYQKVLAGASSEDIAVVQSAVDASKVALSNAQRNLEDARNQQQVLADNAYRSYLNSGLAAIPSAGNINTSNPTITGTYTGVATGSYTISQRSNQFTISGLEDGVSQYISTMYPVPFGTRGLYIQFPTNYITVNDTWTIPIPNPNASTYVANYNAYLSAKETQRVAVATAENTLASAKATLDQELAALASKQAQARPADIALVEAQILAAQGSVQTAQAALENTIIRAPASGTITSVDIKVGELATALKEVFVLQDVENLHLEANISEANIANIKTGQPVDVTFDAFGPDQKYQGAVLSLDPASTVVSGVVNYKLTTSVEQGNGIRPGLTANMEILTADKKGALAIPQRAVLSHDSKKFVRVITDPAKKTYAEQEVATGLEADQGLVEILSGLTEGQEIVTFIPQK